MSKPIYAGIDAGGTEFKCIVGTGPDDVLAFEKIQVTYPEETLSLCLGFFKAMQEEHGTPAGMGIASFGPVDLQQSSATYGYITTSTKALWSDTNITGYFKEALGLPIAFDTDVNGALLGEQQWGAAQGLHSAVYVTIGTGVGAGVMMDGHLLHGAIHTEAGHMLLPRHVDDGFHGACPFHGACLEGLASGPAIAERWLQDPKTLPSDHPAWELQAHYLASMCVNLVLTYSPQRVILGGGVMERSELFKLIRLSYLAQMNGYLGRYSLEIDEFIVGAGLGSKAGALGALALAKKDLL